MCYFVFIASLIRRGVVESVLLVKGGKFPKRVVPLRQMQQCTAPSLNFSIVLIMSTLQNEVLLENIYEELMAELIDTGNLAMMSEDDINFEVNRRFQDISN